MNSANITDTNVENQDSFVNKSYTEIQTRKIFLTKINNIKFEVIPIQNL